MQFTPAHDVCEDYYHHGVGQQIIPEITIFDPIAAIDVTMYQRGSTYIMSVKKGLKMLAGGELLSAASAKTLNGSLYRIICGGWCTSY